MSIISYVALRHVLRFLSAYTLAVVECVNPRTGKVAWAAVVELTDSRFGITAEPVLGCVWRLLVQEGQAGVAHSSAQDWRWWAETCYARRPSLGRMSPALPALRAHTYGYGIALLELEF